jgi:hypothetical protein
MLVVAASHAAVAAADPTFSAAANSTFAAEIRAAHPDATFPSTEGSRCPEVYSREGLQYSVCFGEYRTGSTWHLDGGEAIERETSIGLTLYTHAAWRREWVTCSLGGFGVSVPGRLISNNNCGRHQPETDPYFVAVEVYPSIRMHMRVTSAGWQFTESAGFTSSGVYHVRRAAQSYVFTNALGDSFRYTP